VISSILPPHLDYFLGPGEITIRHSGVFLEMHKFFWINDIAFGYCDLILVLPTKGFKKKHVQKLTTKMNRVIS
jgi:hypothetical protein